MDDLLTTSTVRKNYPLLILTGNKLPYVGIRENRRRNPSEIPQTLSPHLLLLAQALHLFVALHRRSTIHMGTAQIALRVQEILIALQHLVLPLPLDLLPQPELQEPNYPMTNIRSARIIMNASAVVRNGPRVTAALKGIKEFVQQCITSRKRTELPSWIRCLWIFPRAQGEGGPFGFKVQ